jgi:hypothetical protein
LTGRRPPARPRKKLTAAKDDEKPSSANIAKDNVRLLAKFIEKVERANALARKDKRAAVRLASLTLRSLSAGLPNFYLIWGRLARPESRQPLLKLKGVQQLATWWIEHANPLGQCWPLRLLFVLHQSAVELHAFRSNRLKGWARKYFDNIREKRELRKSIIVNLETCLLTLDHLDEVLADDPFGVDRAREINVLRRFYPAAMDLLRELHHREKEVRLAGRAATSPKKAERGRIVRLLCDSLESVPHKIVDSFVADFLEVFWFGTSATVKNVQSIRRQQARRTPAE